MRDRKKMAGHVLTVLALLLIFVGVGAALAAYSGPNRTVTTVSWIDEPYGVWARHENYVGECAPYQYGFRDCIICTWSGSPGRPCGSATYNYTLGTQRVRVTTTTTLPPATVSGATACAQPGNAGWCRGGATLNLSANEPVAGYVITGIETDAALLCATNATSPTCSWAFPEGSTALDFWALSSYGDTSLKASATMAYDPTPPSVAFSLPAPDGAGGWYISMPSVAVTGDDRTSGFAGGVISVDGGANQAGPLLLGEGMHNLSASGSDAAGNSASASAQVNVDLTDPVATVDLSIPSADGANGWYVSPLSASPAGSDALSGLASVTVSLDGGASQSGAIAVPEGTHTVSVTAVDVAGRSSTQSIVLRIDISEPVSRFTSHADGDVVFGTVELQGASSDAVSGLRSAGEISLDGGASWQTLSLDGAGNWSYSWDTSALPNGDYALLMRATDAAGNRAHTASLQLRVANEPPSVRLSPQSWSVGNGGTLTVTPKLIPIGEVSVHIKDPRGRWPTVVHRYPAWRIPSGVSWNGRFADGTLAPPGEYTVRAVACDIYDHCAEDKSTITVPLIAIFNVFQPPASTPTPTATVALSPTPTAPDVAPPTPTPARVIVTPPTPTEAIAVVEEPAAEPPPTWPTTTLAGLLLAFLSIALLDPRPRALNHISEALIRLWKG